MKPSSKFLSPLTFLVVSVTGLLVCLPAHGWDINARLAPRTVTSPAMLALPLSPVVPAPPACAPAPSGLVGWWKGDGNGNDSAGTNNATVPAGVTYAPAEVDLGFNLDGQAHQIIVPDAPALNFSGNQDFSLEAWIQPLANPGNWQDIMAIIDKRIAPDTITQLGYELDLQGGVVVFQMADVLAPYSWNNFSAGPDLRDGKFHHVAVTVHRTSTTGGQIYIDGQVVLTFDPTVCPGDLSNTGPLRIGNHATPGLQAYYKGIIDEVSLYNRALASGEITAIYNAGSAGKCAPAAGDCVTPPSDLISWWPGEGNADDIVSGNNGSPVGKLSYTNGEVGQAFQFDGSTSYIPVPASPSLNIGATGSGITIECWVKPYHLGPVGAAGLPIVEWDSSSTDGTALWFEASYQLFADIKDTSNNAHVIQTAANTISTNSLQHVAVTYDKASGAAMLYINGVMAVSNNIGSFTPQTTYPMNIGRRTGQPIGDGDTFSGLIDELSLYNRALSASEIAAIYNAGSAGKCAPASTACYPPPSGIAGWWPGDGNANDIVGGDNGILEGGATFAPGKVGLGFRLDGTNGYVQIPDSATLKPTNVTVEAWVWLDPNISTTDNEQIVFKQNTWSYYFEGYTILKAHVDNGDGTFTDRFSSVVSRNGDQVVIYSTTAVQRGVWYHVATTYDGNQLTLYVNGVAEASAIAGFPLDYGTEPVFIGTTGVSGVYINMFAGIIDETSIYNRALSASEIQAIYAVGSAGKCKEPLPPGITVQPTSQMTVEGSNVVLSVTASGNGPFSYQWSFNGTNISGATNATLTLTDLHPDQSGNYTVTITTPYGSITSASAAVTVIAQTILIYNYSGIDRCTTAGHTTLNAYAGRLFFIPDTTNGTFVGWTMERGKRQYWVNPLSDYLLITVAGEGKHTITVLGQAGQGIDTNGKAHLWSDLHKGQNTVFTVGQNKNYSFPDMLTDAATRIYPDSVTGNMVMDESTSIYDFLAHDTQVANNQGQTMQDLVNTLTSKLAAEGYQLQ